MLGKLKKDQKGFTIIEVLIVLAIAGLIMLIVFLAIPALQRNQRNNARNSEASRISSAVTECLANRNGIATACQTYTALGIEEPADDVMNGYQQFTSIDFASAGDGGTTEVINIAFDLQCTETGDGTETGGARDFVVRWQNEPEVERCIGSESN